MQKIVLSVDFPRNLICPISHNLMREPVYILSDEGIKYEFDRENIDRWLDKHDTNPLTGMKLKNKTIYPNPDKKVEVVRFLESYSVINAHENENESDGDSKISLIDLSDASLTMKEIDMSQELKGSEYVADMPECSEKLLLGVVSNLKYCFQSGEIPNSKVHETIVTKLYELCGQQYYKVLDEMKASLARSDWKCLNEQSESLLKEIRPFDIKELVALVGKAKEAAISIKDQDIILLLGRTGSGKSTTTHFLCGSTMEKTVVKGLEHIQASGVKTDILREVKTSPEKKSETRYIKAIPVSFESIGYERDGGIVICDTPGFEDTQGAEVDIANAIGVVEAVRGAKTVRPVVLISNKSIGDRCELLKELAHLLVRTVANIKDHLDAFTFLFTKYSSDELSQVYAELKNLKSHLSSEDKSDKSLMALFESMLFSTEDGALGLDPINDKPKIFHRKLMGKTAIRHPEEVFQFSITDKSKGILKDQVMKHQLSIYQAAKQGNYGVVQYKLDELKTLMSILNQDFIKQIYDECKRHLIAHLREKYQAALQNFDKTLDDNNNLTEADIIQYKASISNIKNAELIREKHLTNDAIQSAALLQNLTIKVKELSNNVGVYSLDNVGFRQRLDKIKLLCQHFPSFNEFYSKHLDELSKKLEEISTIMSLNIEECNWTELTKSLSLIKKIGKELSGHVESSKINSIYKSFCEKALLRIKSISENARSLLNKDRRLTKSDIKVLIRSISQLNESKSTVGFDSHIEPKELEKSVMSLFADLMGFFTNLKEKIQNTFTRLRGDAFEELEVLMEEMNSIHEMQGMQSMTSEIFYQTIETLAGYIKEMRRESEHQLKLFLDSNGQDCKKFSRSLVTLKKAGWLERYKPGITDETMLEIREEILSRAEVAKHRAQSLNLRLEDYSNIKELGEIISNFQTMIPLEAGLPALTAVRESLMEGLLLRFKDNFKLISLMYGLDTISLTNLESIRRDYVIMLEEGDSALLMKLAGKLQSNGFKNLDDLNRQIEEIKGEKEGLLKKIESHEKDKALELDRYTDLKRIKVGYDKIIGVENKKSRTDSLEYLKQRGYKSYDDFSDDLEDSERALNNRESFLRKCCEEKSKILGDLERYTALRNEIESIKLDEISKNRKKSQEWIAQRGCLNIESLDENISRMKEKVCRIDDSRSKPLTTLAELDVEKAEIVCCYLKACNQFGIMRDELHVVENQFYTTIRSYVEYFNSILTEDLRKAISPSADSSDKIITQNAQNLLSKLRHLTHIMNKQPNIFMMFPERILDSYKELLEQNRNELSEEMMKLQTAKNNQRLKSKLSLARALSRFDYMIEGEKYNDLYIKYRDLFYAEAKITPDILTAIKDLNFITIASHMSRFTELEDPATLSAAEQLRDTLSRALVDLVSETRTKVIMLGSSVDSQTVSDIQSIVVNLNKIKDAQQLLLKYLEENVRVELVDCTLFVKNTISDRIIRFLDSIAASIDSNNFNESNVRMDIVSTIRNLLGTYCTQDIVVKLDELTKRIERVLDEVVLKYIDNELKDYPAYPPKEIFEKFQEVATKDRKYTHALAKIKSGILERCRKVLEAARECALPAERNPHIRQVTVALKFLPDDLRKALEVELDAAKEEIKGLVDEHESRVKDLIETGNVEGLQDYLGSSESHAESKKHLREHVLKAIKDSKVRIDSCLDQDDIVGMIPDLKKVYDYRVRLGDSIPLLNNYYAQIKARLGSSMEQFLRVINDNLSETDDDSINASLNIKIMEKALENLTIIIGFKDELRRISLGSNAVNNQPVTFRGQSVIPLNIDFDEECLDIYPDNFMSNIEKLNKKMIKYFESYNKDYIKAVEFMQCDLLIKIMARAEAWDPLLKKIKRYISTVGVKYSPHYQNSDDQKNSSATTFSSLDSILSKIKYSDIVSCVIFEINKYADYFAKLRIFNDLTLCSEISRKQFYEELNRNINVLLSVSLLKQHLNIKSIDLDKISSEAFSGLKIKFEALFAESMKIISKSTLNKTDYNAFDRYYAALTMMSKEVPSLVKTGVRVSEFLQKLDVVIGDKLSTLESKVSSASELVDIADGIIAIKQISECITRFKERIDLRIDVLLHDFKRQKGGAQALAKLATMLNTEQSGIGQIILEEHKCFVGYQHHVWSVRTQTHGIEYILDHIDGDDLDRQKLRSRYNEFDGRYKQLVTKNLSKHIDFASIVSSLKVNLLKVRSNDVEIRWTGAIRDLIPEILAHVFAIWTLKNASHYFDAEGADERESYLLRPHAAQIISILRMLGIDDGTASLKNNLVQIGTGEGKSVTLAATASVLALLGFDVSCACYSDYLSVRDYNSFKDLFDTLGVLENIHYGTFNKLCEAVINENGNVREIVKSLVSNELNPVNSAKILSNRPKILLIDEVDVFFSKEFYGKTYTPSATLSDPTIAGLTDLIWKERDSITIRKLKATSQFKACCDKYKNWEFLIEEACKDMLNDVKSFISHDYLVIGDKIGYKVQDTIVFNMLEGYKTLFAYYYEKDKGTISEQSLNENICISINCGNFSYAEIPHLFRQIMGVTGTLKTLSKPEQAIVRNIYGICKNTYAPSVYGANNLIFREDADIKIENRSDFFNVIKREIDDRIKGSTTGTKRAVLVFFDSKEKLLSFYNSPSLASSKDGYNVITEELETPDKIKRIKQATTSGQVTLLTKSFGRGTDFVCRDQSVSSNGGTHVIQTFLSAEISEETQIKGRTARQGDHGSYSMVLLEDSLSSFLVDNDVIVKMKASGVYYSVLNKKRTEYFEMQYGEDTKFVDEAKKEHEIALKFLERLQNKDMKFLAQYLGEANKGSDNNKRSRTVCLMDATGSMSHLLQKAKNTVGIMFERAAEILKDNGFAPDAFELQFSVYRNYSSGNDLLLQTSTWETKPSNLRAFMDRIQPEGGQGNEAIEIGLWHASEEARNGEITQVILIGDANPNTAQDVTIKRGGKGEAYWRQTKFAAPTFYMNELQVLKANEIPVHSFYVARSAESSFRQIAQETGGRSEFLDVNSPDGAAMLTNLVTEEILRSVGGDNRGDDLVQAYRAKFARSYK
ncbi:MAG: hypothetical protein K2X50_00940 [Gammaproteobacteria bacterium]|nr:hypothetical protein [Gammaproteobacteria bacterium]